MGGFPHTQKHNNTRTLFRCFVLLFVVLPLFGFLAFIQQRKIQLPACRCDCLPSHKQNSASARNGNRFVLSKTGSSQKGKRCLFGPRHTEPNGSVRRQRHSEKSLKLAKARVWWMRKTHWVLYNLHAHQQSKKSKEEKKSAKTKTWNSRKSKRLRDTNDCDGRL